MKLPFLAYLWSAALFQMPWLAAGEADRLLESGCSRPETPENGEMFILWSGLLVQFRCNNGFKLEGAAAIICRNGSWTQDSPVCLTQDPVEKTTVTAASMKEAQQDEATRLRIVDEAQLQGASKPLLTVIAVPDDVAGQTTRTSDQTDMAVDDKRRSSKEGKSKKGGGGNQKKNKKSSKKEKDKDMESLAKGTKRKSKNDKSAKQSKNKSSKSEVGNEVKKNKGQRNKKASTTPKTEERIVNEVEVDRIESAEDEEAVPVDYSTLDQSCLAEHGTENPSVTAPAIPNGVIVKYARRRNKSAPNNRYAIALYRCSPNYSFAVPEADKLYCRQGRWIGPSPICLGEAAGENNVVSEIETANNATTSSATGTAVALCGDDRGGCEQICDDTDGTITCSCYRGYTLDQDQKSCQDVDECLVDNGGCEGLCVNKQGSYQCFCAAGFRLASNGKKCIDHNECLLRNGHGPCEGTCRNTHGSYQCSCDQSPGTQLAADGHSCEDLDECSIDNFGCSHTCLNTLGTAFCTCPEGYMLGDDWKTCEDIDECELEDEEQLCAGSCINTVGSYRCSEDDESDPSFPEEGEEKKPSEPERESGSGRVRDPDEQREKVQDLDGQGNENEDPKVVAEDPTELVDPTPDQEELERRENMKSSEPDADADHASKETDGHAVDASERDKELLEEIENRVDVPTNSSLLPPELKNIDSHDDHFGPIDPNLTEPEVVEIERVESESDDRQPVETVPLKPVPIGPEPVETEPVEPEPVEPDPVEPEPVEPEPVEPEPVEPEPVEPEPAEPEPVEPEPAEPEPAVPKPVEPEWVEPEQVGSESIDPNRVESNPAEGETDDSEIFEPEVVEFQPAEGDETKAIEPESVDPKSSDPDVESEAGEVGPSSKFDSEADESESIDPVRSVASVEEATDVEQAEPVVEEPCPVGFERIEGQAKEAGEARVSSCQDIDECLDDNGGCSHQCINTPGSAYCLCPDGWAASDLDAKLCLDVDECQVDNHGCSQTCVNNQGSAYCSCWQGYAIQDDNKTCSDVNECLDNNFGCSHVCVNLEGSAECTCPSGYKLKGDKKTCKDVDECLQRNGGCSHQCHNLKGSMRCSCPDGYVLHSDDKTCVDIDECNLPYPEFINNCNGTCVNTPGSFSCLCPPGYESVDFACLDVDECASSPCTTTCINTPGSYKCTCEEGFQEDNNGTCTDVDECPQGVCDQICTNIPGSYVCDCHQGYQLVGDVCQDVNECTNDPCDDGSCRNTVGSYVCECTSGFERIADRCVDIDECARDFPCDGTCTNTPGSYVCSCDPGYQLEINGTCSDIDECLSNPCLVECINTAGSYRCLCPFGYHFEDNVCQDIDECLSNPCDGTCINTEGSYTCQCPSGFVQRGNSCDDINECVHNPCGNGACINLPGSYQCICDPGYELKDGRCEDINECLTYQCGGRCVNLPGTYLCECDKGYKLQGDRCVDEDECLTRPCQGRCINLPGTYRCECDQGYRSENHECIDINECNVRNGGCSHLCTNVPGSFYCSCSPGFEVNYRDTSECIDVNECRNNNGGCSQDCVNTRGSFFCACSDKYYLDADGRTCVEKPPRCPRVPPPDNGEIECIQNVTLNAFAYIEEEGVPTENGRGDMGGSVAGSGRPPKVRPHYDVGSTCSLKCHKGYKLVGDATIQCDRAGHWIGEPATCIPLACPKLYPPENAQLTPYSCATGKTFAGQQCTVRCRPGYRLIGSSHYYCLPTQQWRTAGDPPRCERTDSPVPFIQCPGNMAVTLAPLEKTAYVTFSQPKSNMDWFRYVDSNPTWAKQLGGEVPVGSNTVTFTVRSPISDLMASCNFTIQVIDKEAPRVTNCPSSFATFLEPGETSQIVTWHEPIFTDNVDVVQLKKSREPGELFQSGHHDVTYEAQDAAGNKAKCQFTIHVTGYDLKENIPTKLPRGRVLVRCPGSKPGKYIEMYTYKVPAGCIVINNPSAYRRMSTTLAPRYTVFDWNYGANPSGAGYASTESSVMPAFRIPTTKPTTTTTTTTASNLRIGLDPLRDLDVSSAVISASSRLRDAGSSSQTSLVPGPSWVPSMGSLPESRNVHQIRSPRTRKPRTGSQTNPSSTLPRPDLTWSANNWGQHAAPGVALYSNASPSAGAWCCLFGQRNNGKQTVTTKTKNAINGPLVAYQTLAETDNHIVPWLREVYNAENGRARHRGREKKRQPNAPLINQEPTLRPNRNSNRKDETSRRTLPRPGPSLVSSRDRKRSRGGKNATALSSTPAVLN